MTVPENLTLRPWKIIETHFLPQRQHHLETIFTQGNGYLSTRGSYEERFPSDKQATFIHGMWDDAPIVFTELANAPDWTAAEIWINGKLFRLDQGKLTDYQRYLDLQYGILFRQLTWSFSDPSPTVTISFERFTCLFDQHILVSQIKITPLNAKTDIRVRSSINAHVENNGLLHWDIVNQNSVTNRIDLEVRTRKTLKTLAISAVIKSNLPNTFIVANDCIGCPSIEFRSELTKKDTLTIQKYVGVSTSRDTDFPLSLAIEKAEYASELGYTNLWDLNKEAWDKFWEVSDVSIEGDEIAQTSIRHALFQLRCAAPSYDDKVSIGAKTLSGFGYRGHVFWDTEIFILPLFSLTQPELAKNMLMYRWYTLSGARRKASKNGFRGAQFPWESAETGDEVTPTWVPDYDNPLHLIRIWTGDVEIHITADIAYALHQYWKWTADDEFWIQVGIPILLETALFWADRAENDSGIYSFRRVIGPDEYHEHVDNNPYTNYMVRWHLETAISAFYWLEKTAPEKAQQLMYHLNISEENLQEWGKISGNIVILQDENTGLFEQFEGYFNLRDIDLTQYKTRNKSIQEMIGIDETNKHQVIKQADIIMLLCLFRNHFDEKTWKSNWSYYHPRTDHEFGSSLGPSFYAWAACELGKPDLAYEHFFRAAGSDLLDIRGNAHDGIHAASSGGLWQAIVFGFAGLCLQDNNLSVQPRLPSHWKSIQFKICYNGDYYMVKVEPERANIIKI